MYDAIIIHKWWNHSENFSWGRSTSLVYNAIVIMTIVIILLQCDHNHSPFMMTIIIFICVWCIRVWFQADPKDSKLEVRAPKLLVCMDFWRALLPSFLPPYNSTQEAFRPPDTPGSFCLITQSNVWKVTSLDGPEMPTEWKSESGTDQPTNQFTAQGRC